MKHPTGYLGKTDRRTPRINVRLPDPELRRQLENAALAHRTTISGYVRSLVLEALQKEQEQAEYEEAAVYFG
jgi:uncharacterized protein (DUF1778 family)